MSVPEEPPVPPGPLVPPAKRAHRRPMVRWSSWYDEIEGGPDPAEVKEAAALAATALVRGARGSDPAVVADVAERVLHLADTEGIEAIAELWSGADATSLAGCLWRLYLLRGWVHADPLRAAREFDAGRRRAPVAEVVAGVADPPGPAELRAMIDDVLRGIATTDFADVCFRAAAFARVVAAGRAVLDDTREADLRRMLGVAEQLQEAGRLELAGNLA